MSKIGRKPIALDGLTVDVKGNVINYKGSKASGVYELPSFLTVDLLDDNKFLKLSCTEVSNKNKAFWGMHRALLANKLKGAAEGFEQKVTINGLGYKAAKSGQGLVFSLGFSHKKNLDLPAGVTVDIDKSGQNLTVKSHDKELVGHVCSEIKSLRPVEPYKGSGIKLAEEQIVRKAGKAKAT